MAVYSSGSCKVKIGSQEVVGENTQWNSYIDTGDLFKLTVESVHYSVAAVNTATNITLAASYANANYSSGASIPSSSYQIVKDFTSNYNVPEMSPTDRNFAHIYTKGVQLLDKAIHQRNVTNTSASYTVVSSDFLITISGAAAAVPVHLPSGSGNVGRLVRVCNLSATYIVSIRPNGSDTIQGEASLLLDTQYEDAFMQCATTNLWIY